MLRIFRNAKIYLLYEGGKTQLFLHIGSFLSNLEFFYITPQHLITISLYLSMPIRLKPEPSSAILDLIRGPGFIKLLRSVGALGTRE